MASYVPRALAGDELRAAATAADAAPPRLAEGAERFWSHSKFSLGNMASSGYGPHDLGGVPLFAVWT